MILSVIAAVADNGVIGRDNGLPWHLPADLRHFQRLTVGHTLVMGRRTYESIGRPLPRRRNIVLSRSSQLRIDGVEVVGSLDEALHRARHDEEVFVIGGAGVFERALERAERLFLTRVHAEIDGDTFFPALDTDRWRRVEAERREADADNEHACTFERWERVHDASATASPDRQTPG